MYRAAVFRGLRPYQPRIMTKKFQNVPTLGHYTIQTTVNETKNEFWGIFLSLLLI